MYIPTSFITRPSKIYPNLDFWIENKPSGNPGLQPGRLEWQTIPTIKIRNQGEVNHMYATTREVNFVKPFTIFFSRVEAHPR
jgi:hypothetical protein